MSENLGIPGRTLRHDVAVEGTGIHSGVPCRVMMKPRPAGHGIAFQRAGRPSVPATVSTANAPMSDRRTVLVGEGGERFEQVEHLMAALAAAGITDLLVEQEGPEVPFLGGGSFEYLESILSTGTVETGSQQVSLVIDKTVTLRDGDAILTATPHDGFRLSCFVEFPGTVVGSAGYTLEMSQEAFRIEVSKARTFALARDIEMLRQAGLARGGNLSNAVVFDNERYHNEALHYPDEVVRHKVIDLLGDLALIGRPLRGHFWAWRAGHRSHVQFAQRLAKEFSPHQ